MNLFVKASGSAIPNCTISGIIASSTYVSMQLLIAMGATPPRFLTISVIWPISCHFLYTPCITWLIGIICLVMSIEWLSSAGSVGIGHIPISLLSVTTSLMLEAPVPIAIVVAAAVVISSS